MSKSSIAKRRLVNGITLVGPDLLATAESGALLTTIASAFPRYRLVVSTPGIHAWQVMEAVELLSETLSHAENAEIGKEEEAEIYRDAVSLLIRNDMVLIRADFTDMDRIFAADELLQQLLPKERIQFTGANVAGVRKRVHQRGESWRISPQPRSVCEMVQQIRSSRGSVGTGAVYYHSALTGSRFLTYEELMRISPLLELDREEALARLKEIVCLTRLVNDYGARELRLFVEGDKDLPMEALEEVIGLLEKSESSETLKEAEQVFDSFARSFADAAGPSRTSDNEEDVPWRTAMFCRLFDIDAATMEEWALGLSAEFHLNVRWLPGARLCNGALRFESSASLRVRKLVSHYHSAWPGLVSINIGRVEAPLTRRDRSGEEREVYLVCLGLHDGREQTRIVRMMKWSILHRLGKGIPLDRAISETFHYRQYISDRLIAFTELEIRVPHYNEVAFFEDVPGVGSIPIIFFERSYSEGIVTERIPPARYAQPDFVVKLARLLGGAAGISMVMGRACPRTGHIFFDDADEVVQFDGEGLPKRLIMIETTGSFNDCDTPLESSLPHCLDHLFDHMRRAKKQGVGNSEILKAIDAFACGLGDELERLQLTLRMKYSTLRSLFADRSSEPGGIRSRWEKVLDRLERASPEGLRLIVADNVPSEWRDS